MMRTHMLHSDVGCWVMLLCCVISFSWQVLAKHHRRTGGLSSSVIGGSTTAVTHTQAKKVNCAHSATESSLLLVTVTQTYAQG